jgi:predicted GTPase
MMTCTIVQRHQPSIANIAMPELKNVNVISMMIAIAGGMKKMNNLFERLKPEALAILQQEGEKYPNAIKSLIQELKINRYIIDLSYGTVISMSNFLNLDNYRLTEILNQFEENENIIN